MYTYPIYNTYVCIYTEEINTQMGEEVSLIGTGVGYVLKTYKFILVIWCWRLWC